ncbi:uncharacterized protein LOC135472813 [Liolophura sinensis]|uniref:uncharacterized protein LOC135472813 n=1 Tax=Liolophura sinensis TaxID=3198878 RepID=UPI0031588952
MADVRNVEALQGRQSLQFVENCVKSSASSSREKCEECFSLYDVDSDGYLSRDEFLNLCKDVFVKCNEDEQSLTTLVDHMLKLLDTDQDGRLSKEEFKICWCYWLKQVLEPVSALVIVDVQNDFLEGSLSLSQCPAGQCGLPVIPVINNMLDNVQFDVVVYSKDWHPKDHISFLENVNIRPLHPSSKVKSEEAKPFDTVVFDTSPLTEQVLWPAHCIQGSWGAELHKNLKVVDNGYVVNKGTSPHVDSYSAFWDNNKLSQTELVQLLSKLRVTDVYVCGLAYDICVGFTARHAIDHGFRTVLVEDACRGVDLENIEKTRFELRKKGAVVVQSDQVGDMVDGKLRAAELGVQAAVNVNVALKLLKTGRV